MQWTREAPTVPGWYWRRQCFDGALMRHTEWEICEVSRDTRFVWAPDDDSGWDGRDWDEIADSRLEWGWIHIPAPEPEPEPAGCKTCGSDEPRKFANPCVMNLALAKGPDPFHDPWTKASDA